MRPYALPYSTVQYKPGLLHFAQWLEQIPNHVQLFSVNSQYQIEVTSRRPPKYVFLNYSTRGTDRCHYINRTRIIEAMC